METTIWIYCDFCDEDYLVDEFETECPMCKSKDIKSGLSAMDEEVAKWKKLDFSLQRLPWLMR